MEGKQCKKKREKKREESDEVDERSVCFVDEDGATTSGKQHSAWSPRHSCAPTHRTQSLTWTGSVVPTNRRTWHKHVNWHMSNRNQSNSHPHPSVATMPYVDGGDGDGVSRGWGRVHHQPVAGVSLSHSFGNHGNNNNRTRGQ